MPRSGLGLSQVYGFASHSGGTVQVRFEPGRGATFTMFLPRSDLAESGTDVDAEHLVQGAMRRGTVLIVEDDSRGAEVSAAFVQQLGYQTIVAAGAQEALDLLAR